MARRRNKRAGKKDHRDTCIMLLGPGEKNDVRNQAIKELKEEKKYRRAISMEMFENVRADVNLDAKFERIIITNKPDLFIVLFHKDADMDAVIFEIGWICGRFGSRLIKDRLYFMYERGYDFFDTTAYIRTLFPRVVLSPFDENDPFGRISEQIHKMVIEKMDST